MKKTRFKQAIFLGFVILVSSFLLWNCETEEEFQDLQANTPEKPIKSIQRHVIPLQSLMVKNHKAFEILTGLVKEESKLGGKSEEYSDEYDLHYDLSEIYVIEGNTYEQFSFVVRSSDQPEHQFKNYLLLTYPNDQYQQFIITYEYDAPNADTFHPVFVEELQGSQLLTRSAGCAFPEIIPIFTEVCTNYSCSGAGNHSYGQSNCDCGITVNCEPAKRVCTIETTYNLVCGGSGTGGTDDTGHGNDDNNQTGGTGNSGNDTSNDSDNENVDVIPIEELNRRRECRKITNLLTQYPAYKAKLLQLASEAPTATFEKGVAIDVNGNDVIIPNGVGGKLNPPLNPTDKYWSIAHIHDAQGANGNGTFSVPSLNDLANLGHISVIKNKARLSKMVYFVFTADKTYYALTIKNPSKFNAFWEYQKVLDLNINASLTSQQRNQYLQTLQNRAKPNNQGVYHKYYNNANGSLIDETSTNNEQQLKYFLQFLKEDGGMGVSVFETDAQLSKFTEVKLNSANLSGTLERNDCQ